MRSVSDGAGWFRSALTRVCGDEALVEREPRLVFIARSVIDGARLFPEVRWPERAAMKRLVEREPRSVFRMA